MDDKVHETNIKIALDRLLSTLPDSDDMARFLENHINGEDNEVYARALNNHPYVKPILQLLQQCINQLDKVKDQRANLDLSINLLLKKNANPPISKPERK